MPGVIARAGGAFAAGLGLTALLGWILELPLLTSLGQGWIPMAPSTALLFVLLGPAVSLSAGVPLSRAARRAGAAVGAVGALVGLLLFFLAYLGIRPEIEHVGFAIAGTVADSPIGHISPITALGFTLAGLSLVATLTSSAGQHGRAMAAFWLAGLMVFVSIIFLLAYLFGTPLLYGGKFIPPALPTSVALVALGAALLALSGPLAWASGQQIDAETLRASRSFVLVFALMTIGLITAGGVYFRNEAALHRAEIERQISAIADLKVSELANWRRERFGDASLLHGNIFFADLVRRALGNSQDAQARYQLHNWLRQIRDAYEYDEVALIDAQGAVQISIPDHSLADNHLEGARQALRSGQVSLEDFHRDEPGGAPHLSLLVPIADDAAGGRPLGIVVLEIDPAKYLYPLIERWPTLSPSAETLLVRRDGDDVLYLNELRHRKNTALSLRFPLTKTEMPTVKAVLGEEGMVQGMDYRGVPVIAAARTVPGTPWFLVARIDTEEFLASIEESLWLTAGLVAALLLSSGAALGLIWRQQRVRHYRERVRAAEALTAGAARYRAVTQSAADAIVTADSAGLIVGWNAGAERIFGYGEAEALGQPLTLLMPQRYHEGHLAGFSRVLSGGKGKMIGGTAEMHGLTRSGSEFPLELSLSAWEASEGRFFTGIIRDISERKRAEMALARQKDLYDMLSQTNQAIVRMTAREALFPAVCRIAVVHGRFRFAWFAMIDEQNQQLKPVAHYGEDAGYVQEIRVSAAASDRTGGGPAGQAFRAGHHVISNDLLTDPASAPWHEAARRAGVRASAAFPIRERNAVVGVMVLAASAPGYFTEDLLPTLDEMALDVSFALDHFRRTAELARVAGALRASESNYRQLFVANPHPMWVYDLESLCFLAVNDAAVTHYGYTRNEFEAMDIADIRPAEDVPRLLESVARVEAGKVKEAGVWRHRKKDGTLIDVEITSHVLDFGGRRAAVVLALDVTERKRAEKLLHAAEEQFRSLVEQSIAGIYVIQDGSLVYVNPRFAEIFGYESTDEPIGRNALSVVAENHRAAVADNVQRWLKGAVRRIEYSTTGLRKDGSTVEVGVHGARASYRGRPAIIGMVQDISEKKRAEEQIQRYVTQLETAFMSTVNVATTLSEMRDPYTAGHERRVAEIAVAIGAELGWDKRRQEGLKVAGHLHDIGKITIPAEILARPGKLSSIEYQLIKAHPQAGYDVLKDVGFPWPVAQVALQHHERIDGSGYPQGLKGEAILIEARIMAVADVVEAMAAHRPYRPGLGIDKALAEIERGRGTAYDTAVADACLRLFREQGYRLSV
jgi:PAS domain S-box-containing protein